MGKNQSKEELRAEWEREKAAEKKRKAEELMSEPWRMNKKNGWTDEEVSAMQNEVAGFAIPQDSGVEHFNILLLGPPAAGKSSFCNTVASAFSNKLDKLASSGDGETSLTKMLKSYPIRHKTDGNNTKLGIKFWDTMGMDDNLKMKTLCKIMDGKVKNYTKLDGNLEDVETRSESEIQTKHKMHCILFVINATKLAALGDTLMQTGREIATEAEERGLPTMIVLTNVDKWCPHVHKDTKTVFKSQRIRDLVERDAVKATGFPAYKIHPIRNYSTQGINETGIDFLTLLLMIHVMECCEEYCEHLEDLKEDY